MSYIAFLMLSNTGRSSRTVSQYVLKSNIEDALDALKERTMDSAIIESCDEYKNPNSEDSNK